MDDTTRCRIVWGVMCGAFQFKVPELGSDIDFVREGFVILTCGQLLCMDGTLQELTDMIKVNFSNLNMKERKCVPFTIIAYVKSTYPKLTLPTSLGPVLCPVVELNSD